MNVREIGLTVLLTLITGGLLQFIVALLKRKPELRNLDAVTVDVRVQTADRLIVRLTEQLERAERRGEELENKLDERDQRIERLEERLQTMQVDMRRLETDLNAARAEVAALRNDH